METGLDLALALVTLEEVGGARGWEDDAVAFTPEAITEDAGQAAADRVAQSSQTLGHSVL